MNDLPRQKLREILTQYGRSICENPQHCKGLLLDLCGEQKREINILIAVLEEHAVADLMHSSASVPTEMLLARLTERLCDNRSMEKEAARWGVESWALALGMSTSKTSRTPQAKTAVPAKTPPQKSPDKLEAEKELPVSSPQVLTQNLPLQPGVESIVLANAALVKSGEQQVVKPLQPLSVSEQVAGPTSQLLYKKLRKSANLVAVLAIILNIVILFWLDSFHPSGFLFYLLGFGLPFLTGCLVVSASTKLSKDDRETVGCGTAFVTGVADVIIFFLAYKTTDIGTMIVVGIIAACFITGACYAPVAIYSKE